MYTLHESSLDAILQRLEAFDAATSQMNFYPVVQVFSTASGKMLVDLPYLPSNPPKEGWTQFQLCILKNSQAWPCVLEVQARDKPGGAEEFRPQLERLMEQDRLAVMTAV